MAGNPTILGWREVYFCDHIHYWCLRCDINGWQQRRAATERENPLPQTPYVMERYAALAAAKAGA